MNIILKIVIVINFVVLMSQGIAAQPRHKITNAKIQPKVVSGKSVDYINVKSLKTGSNYMKLRSGKVLHAEVAGGKVTSLKITNRRGVQVTSFKINDDATQFECDTTYCSCEGDKDCDDMFTKNLCGGKAICVDDVCVCDRL